MLLCQGFEDTCKRTLRWWSVAKRLSDGDRIDLESAAKDSERLMESFLGIALRKIVGEYKINDEDARTLTAAKDARNYIAHESANSCSQSNFEIVFGHDEWTVLREHVLALANGHNLLCCWAYEFEERQPRPLTLSQAYPQQITDWILRPIEQWLDSPRS